MKKSIHLLLLICFLSTVQAQSTKFFGLAIFNEKTSLFSNPNPLSAPLHLGGSISLDFVKETPDTYQFTHTYQLGYYYHQDLHHALFISWKPKFAWAFDSGLNAHALTGVGYIHTFSDQQTWELSNGVAEHKI